MPELPDVEVYRHYVNSTSLHQTIEKVEIFSADILENISRREFRKHVEMRKFESTDRHGKYLFVRLSEDGCVVFHFGMTGLLEYFKDSHSKPKYSRVLFTFDNSYHLAFVMPRKLGKLALIEDPSLFVKDRGLGADPLDRNFTLEEFKHALTGTKSTVKSALMNQKCIAGIGNIYSDEILFQARLNPRTKAGQLSEQSIKELYHAMKKVLKKSIENQADPNQMPRNYLIAHRKKGGACPACGEDLIVEKISGRTSYHCPECQR